MGGEECIAELFLLIILKSLIPESLQHNTNLRTGVFWSYICTDLVLYSSRLASLHLKLKYTFVCRCAHYRN